MKCSPRSWLHLTHKNQRPQVHLVKDQQAHREGTDAHTDMLFVSSTKKTLVFLPVLPETDTKLIKGIYELACAICICVWLILVKKSKDSAHMFKLISLLFLFFIFSFEDKIRLVGFRHACLCNYVNQIQNGMNRKSINSIFTRLLAFRVQRLYADWWVKKGEIAKRT